MPVIVKQNQIDQLYEYQLQQAAADFAVRDTAVTSSVHQRLLLFRAHHHKCASRRRNALANEMRQETRRAEWLRRKYVDSVRPQQPLQQQSSMSTSSRHTQAITATGGEVNGGTADTVSGGGGVDIPDMKCVHNSELVDVKPFANGTTATLPVQLSGPPASARSKATTRDVPGDDTVEIDTTVFIKREPDTRDCQSSASPCGDGMDVSGGPGTDCTTTKPHSDGLKQQQRRLSSSLRTDHCKWSSLPTSEQDTRDDLRLTAYDVIAGVISTHPIKPLEPESENATSKLKPLASKPVSTPTTTTTTTTQHVAATPTTISSSSTNSLPKVSKEQHYLVHELDEFSKIMDEVTQEQTAMELAAAETVYSEHSHKPHMVSPYSCPQEVTAPNSSFYQHKYSQLQANQNQSQVDYHHHNHRQQHSSSMSADCKSPLLLPNGGMPGRLSVLSDLPSSSSSSQPVPLTPTTPLEHFSSFPSPSPTHLAPSVAAHSGTSHHLPTHHPSTPHLPPHPSTPHLSPHLGTPHPLHPGTLHPLHPGTPHHPSHQPSAQQVVCQPYPSTPLPYPYSHPPEANSYQSPVSAAVADSWSLAAHHQQTPQLMGGQGRQQMTAVAASQGSLKDSILARVSSRVVAIAGQKRPPMLDLTPGPPAKLKGGIGGNMLDHCGGPVGGAPPPLYSPIPHHIPSPYEPTCTTPLGLSSVSFPPHQQL